jgi:hypothetical protein
MRFGSQKSGRSRLGGPERGSRAAYDESITFGNVMSMHRITATLSNVAERVEGVVRGPRLISSSDATLAGLALSPRTVLDLSAEQCENLEAIVSARQSAAAR